MTSENTRARELNNKMRATYTCTTDAYHGRDLSSNDVNQGKRQVENVIGKSYNLLKQLFNEYEKIITVSQTRKHFNKKSRLFYVRWRK